MSFVRCVPLLSLEVAKNVLCKVRAIIVTPGGQECPL